MDPEACLAAIRALIPKIHENDDLGPGGANLWELADLVQALDSWLSAGGFLPEAWRVQDRLTPGKRRPPKAVTYPAAPPLPTPARSAPLCACGEPAITVAYSPFYKGLMFSTKEHRDHCCSAGEGEFPTFLDALPRLINLATDGLAIASTGSMDPPHGGEQKGGAKKPWLASNRATR